MYDIILSFITAFTLTFFAIPSIINIAKKKNLMEEPGERRSHDIRTPSLGGIAIFGGVLFSIVLWTPFNVFGDLQYILCAFIIIFLIGAKDDLLPMAPWKKLLGELFAAAILVYKSNVKLTSLYGIFGVHEIADWVSIPLSIFTILVIINAFNLIDGINGLSGSISTLICILLGAWFYLTGFIELAIVAIATAGSTIAFLKYNFTPARIFMGDTGSLLLGLVCSILVLKFIEVHNVLTDSPYAFKAIPAMAVGILILPLFDTFRVFTTRMLRGRSPMSPDRNHIHHLLIDVGLSHMQATTLLVIVNLFFIYVVFSFQNMGNLNLLIVILGLASVLTLILIYIKKQKQIKRSRSI
jgi:UDP-N-acetylmuramyl pentapeptide phosphotransferase/UDP-N-acetylglucosamine-1-phosphate transferase